MGQARLRRMQDSAAGRANSLLRNSGLNKSESNEDEDDYEHTEEYYDTERNKAVETVKPDIQNMSSDSLSDGLYERSIKQKHGRAVQTVSEMMQDELEPLPINTFE